MTPKQIWGRQSPRFPGKTTLLNIISGIDDATGGKIYINNEELGEMDDDKKTKYRAQNMGFIFQTFNLIPVLTSLENVEVPLLVSGVDAKEARKRAAKMLEVVGLGERLDHKPNELSGGQRQRVTIARALAHNPKVIWADEPTRNLDSKTADGVFELMLGLAKEYEQTLVVITHDKTIAERTERVIRMDSGKLVR